VNLVREARGECRYELGGAKLEGKSHFLHALVGAEFECHLGAHLHLISFTFQHLIGYK